MGTPICSDQVIFLKTLQKAVTTLLATDKLANLRLIIHHWLDVMSSSSLEGLVINLALMFEAISAASEVATIPDSERPSVHNNSQTNSDPHHLLSPHYPSDLFNLKKNLVRTGTLSGVGTIGWSKDDYAVAASEWLRSADMNIARLLNINTNVITRFTQTPLLCIGSYSTR